MQRLRILSRHRPLVGGATAATALTTIVRHQSIKQFPAEGALHTPGRSAAEGSEEDGSTEGKETWSQYSARMRHGRRRMRTVDVASKMSYEYRMLKTMCRKRPTMRQWAIRDDMCIMNPGVVFMSPSMQGAFMRVFRMRNKGDVRAALRDIIPVLMYRNSLTHAPEKYFKPEDMIPKDEAETLNQKKRELFERKTKIDKYHEVTLRDEGAQARLRRRIRKKLMNFQRKMTVSNAIASRAVLYSDSDAIGYMLFRGPPMYAALHRVFYELSKQLPHFVPKTMLDFGAGTGTAILVAKEVYDPASLSQPLYRSFRQAMQMNASSQEYQLGELRYDLKRLQRNNEEKKKARFMAVSALLENGEIDPEDLPKDLLKEIVAATKAATFAAEQRKQAATQHGRQQSLMDEEEWGNSTTDPDRQAGVEDASDVREGEEENPFGYTDDTTGATSSSSKGDDGPKTWWQKYIDDETSAAAERAQKRLRPLQNITAVEPSPGMMETAMVVLNEEANNVQWKRYLMPEDLADQHDLVVSAYTLSELTTPEARKKAVLDLWKVTKGVLVIIEHANLHNFDMMMQARDAILEEKDVGLWDWQPTIIGPCPHEKKCPLRYASSGIKYRRARICSTDVDYRATFVDAWARESKFKVGYENFSYLIIARNELVPSRAEQRQLAIEREERRKRAERDRKQRELYEASVPVKDIAFERLSEEALHRPGTTSVPSSAGGLAPTSGADALSETVPDSAMFDPAAPGNSLATAVEESEDAPPAEGDKAVLSTSLGSKYPTTPQYVRSGSLINKFVYPVNFPPATHRYNRAFIDQGYQALRPISAGEMITVRHESMVLRNHYQKQIPKYYRIVRQPIKRNKMVGTFCTPDGDLITARVSRNLYSRQQVRHTSRRWGSIGGYRLLARARAGDLFPDDVPMHGINKMVQLSTPNTLMGTKRSLIDQLGVKEGDKIDLDAVDPDTLSPEGKAAYERLNSQRFGLEMAMNYLENTVGLKGATRESQDAGVRTSMVNVDANAELTTMDWARVVDAARRNASQQVRRAKPEERGQSRNKKVRQFMRDRTRQRSR